MPESSKTGTAYRNIGEVAELLDVPQHVLRFWETKFSVIKPLKRAGGRRFYSPQDVALLTELKNLLYLQGYTIKGVQRLLKGARGVPSALEIAVQNRDVVPDPDDSDQDGTKNPVVHAVTADDETVFLEQMLQELKTVQTTLASWTA